MFRNFCSRRLVAACAMLAVSAAYADTVAGDGIAGINISGNLRLYSFSRNYTNSQTTDLRSTSLGGKLKADAGTAEGFGGAVAVYFAQDIGLNNHEQNNKTINPLLMGTGYGIYVPGEAYLQYKTSAFLARAGNQRIDNPWINSSDGFMIPNLYRGGVTTYSPSEGVQLEADRILRFKSRTAVGFDDNNLFALPYDNPYFTGSDNGAAALGANYKGDAASAKGWYYRFYDFAQMGYVQGGYKVTTSGVSPFADLQFMRETGQGAELLGAVDSKAYGAKLGVALPDQTGSIHFAYNRIPTQLAAGTTNGNLLSPYTQVYNTDPLYTTVMNYGLVSARAAGHAWQLGSDLRLLDDKLDASVSFSRYMTQPYVGNVNAFMFDIAYHFDGALKGLTIRNRFGYEHGKNTWGSNYLDNRIMLQYAF